MISPGNFSCSDTMELLDDYRRNNIEPHLRVMLSEHLEQCSSCAEELAMRDTIARLLGESLPAVAPPSGLSPQVQRAISQMSPAVERKKPSLLPWMLATAAIVVSGIALVQMKPGAPSLPTTDIAAVPAVERQVSAEPADIRLAADAPPQQVESFATAGAQVPPPAAAPAQPVPAALPEHLQKTFSSPNADAAVAVPAFRRIESKASVTTASLATTATLTSATIPTSASQNSTSPAGLLSPPE